MQYKSSNSQVIASLASPAARSEAAHPPLWFRLIWSNEEPSIPGTWRAVFVGLIAVAALTVAGLWIEPIIKGPNLAILYMVAVVVTALRWGRAAALTSAISAALSFDFFFVPPYRSFAVTDVWYLITLLGLLSVGFLVSMVTLAAREEAAAARMREAQTAALYSLTKALASESDLDQILSLIERHLFETFNRPVLLWLPGDEGLAIRCNSAGIAPGDIDSSAAKWVFEKGQQAGRGASEFSSSPIYYLPLKTWEGVIGVLGIQAVTANDFVAPRVRQLLETFANQAALAITRAILAKEAQRIQVFQEADKLQKALLNSISHNLRTPLASVTGVLNSLLEDHDLLDAPTRLELLRTAQEEARRLNQLLQNLLDMTRLEGGILRLKIEPHDLQDAVGSALEQLAAATQGRPIKVSIPPELPLVPMDFVPIVQVLVNLLDNAIKYSPAGAPIEIAAALERDHVQVRVADSGEGIPEPHLERVFEKFFRGVQAEAPGGAGLGLSICKGIVEAHRGRIWARRRLPHGTEVLFTLPLGQKP